MRSRIDILKEIMETEKQYALEEIDSEIFEQKMLVLEKQLQAANILSEDEFKQAVQTKEIPLSVENLTGKISIEDLLPTFNVPRTFYRHLKIRREIVELEKSIIDLHHNLHKIKILIAEKRVNVDAATVKIETLEFDLRLSENRLGARKKYLKRNPTKGELIKFSLENYLKFSFGHGISNEIELKKLSSELNEEKILRQNYRKALAEMYATMKTSQLDVSLQATKDELPDFKALIEYQQIINELGDYIRILSSDIKEYSNCLTLLQKDILEIDDSHELYAQNGFGIQSTSEDMKASIKESSDPLLETLETERHPKDPIGLFLIDTTDSSLYFDEGNNIESQESETSANIIVPNKPFPLYEPKLDLEIVGGMEDFQSVFNIKEANGTLNEATKKIIFKSFEGLLEKLIDQETEQVTAKDKTNERKIQFSSLKSDLTNTSTDTSLVVDGVENNDEFTTSESDSLESLTNELTIGDEIDQVALDNNTTIVPPPPPISTQSLRILPTPPKGIESKKELSPKEPIREIDDLTSEILIEDEQPAVVEATEVTQQPRVIEKLIRPEKTAMLSSHLIQGATEAWKLTGKAVFDSTEESNREFLGYIQEVIVFEKNRLGFMLVSEAIANQIIIDKLFDQIKPLWVTEDLLESAEKRTHFLIKEVMESLQVQRDVTLHITKLQEFANFRNINYPMDVQLPPPESIGIIPLEKIKIKRGAIVCTPQDVQELKPYRTAPWYGDLVSEDNIIIGKECYLSNGQNVGKIIALVQHPLAGKLLLLNTNVPNPSLVDYYVKRLEITEKDTRERVWLLKYLIAKQLQIPEGEALNPKTLINYSLRRGFPLLPNEILNSYRVFVSGGAIETITNKKAILKNASRIFQPSELFPLECLKVRDMNGQHLGTAIGISLSENPVLLVSERLSREIVDLFTDAKTEKDAMDDISKSVIGTIGVDFKDSLCIHNILKSLISGKKIQTLQDYGLYLSKSNINGYDLSIIQVVEKGTIFIKTNAQQTSNIFES